MTGPGKPTETRSYFQPTVCALIAFIMTSGVILGPEGTLTISSCCCVRNFRLVPPISTPKIFMPPPDELGCPCLLRELRHRPHNAFHIYMTGRGAATMFT